MEFVSTEMAGSDLWTHVVRTGNLVFVGGQVATDPATGDPAGDTIEEQSERTLENVALALASAGLTLRDVVMVKVYLRDWEDAPAFNEVYARYFPPPAPARTAVQAGRLGRRFKVEVECIAETKDES